MDACLWSLNDKTSPSTGEHRLVSFFNKTKTYSMSVVVPNITCGRTVRNTVHIKNVSVMDGVYCNTNISMPWSPPVQEQCRNRSHRWREDRQSQTVRGPDEQRGSGRQPTPKQNKCCGHLILRNTVDGSQMVYTIHNLYTAVKWSKNQECKREEFTFFVLADDKQRLSCCKSLFIISSACFPQRPLKRIFCDFFLANNFLSHLLCFNANRHMPALVP